MNVVDKRDAVLVWVKAYLAGAHARCIDDLMGCAHFSQEEIQAALQRLIAASEVEALEPVGATRNKFPGVAFHPDTHFRFVRHTDTAYRWQVRITEGLGLDADRVRRCVVSELQERCFADHNWLGFMLPVHA